MSTTTIEAPTLVDTADPKLITKLRKLRGDTAKINFEMGDLLIAANLSHAGLLDAAEKADLSVTTLERCIKVARAFPPKVRNLAHGWNVFSELARISDDDERLSLLASRTDWIGTEAKMAARAANGHVVEPVTDEEAEEVEPSKPGVQTRYEGQLPHGSFVIEEIEGEFQVTLTGALPDDARTFPVPAGVILVCRARS